MEETKLSEAIAEFCTSLTELLTELGMTMQQFQEALELAQARQELQKFDVLDFPNYEIYIDPDLREETRERQPSARAAYQRATIGAGIESEAVRTPSTATTESHRLK